MDAKMMGFIALVRGQRRPGWSKGKSGATHPGELEVPGRPGRLCINKNWLGLRSTYLGQVPTQAVNLSGQSEPALERDHQSRTPECNPRGRSSICAF